MTGQERNQPIRFRDVVDYEVANLTLDVTGLITNGNLSVEMLLHNAENISQVRTFVRPGRSTNVRSSTSGLYPERYG